jgi:hypothetical protein
MPKLINLYIRNVVFGFALSGIFVGALMYFNVANLWHLVNSSSMGWVAGAMLFVFNGIVFAGVQFAIAIMRLEQDDKPSGGMREPLIVDYQPIAIPVEDAHNNRRESADFKQLANGGFADKTDLYCVCARQARTYAVGHGYDPF